MVQVISLLDTKELKTQKTNTKIDTNVDFLELLMKDIKENKNVKNIDKNHKSNNIENEPVLKLNLKQIKSDEKEGNSNLKDDFDLDKDIKIEIKDLETLFDSFNNTDIDNDKLKINNLIIQEIKNILDSKMKQKNILLSKQEIKEFKKIDNIKDLIKFADKKGLNIEKIKFEIPKNIKDDIKQVILKNSIKKSTQKEIDIKHLDTKNILEKKVKIKHLNPLKNNTNKTKQIKKVSLEDVISKKIDKNIISENKENKPKVNHKTQPKTEKIENVKVSLEDLMNIKKDTKKIETIKTEIKTLKTEKLQKNINLNDFISPIKNNKKETIKHSETQNNINLSQTPINEIKAKSVQAKQTIDSFKNNLDEAIKNYKPPISKVNIELNPKNLGKVEVTIIQRGNNIQVNMNTDQNNIMLFQTHQAEFRQALANIGFSNIDMNFNSNQDKERKQNQAKKTYKENENQEIGEIEIKAEYKYA